MTSGKQSWGRLGRLFQRERLDRELDEELVDHLQRRAKDLIAGGLEADEAARQARLELGGLDAIREECRDARGTRWAEVVFRDCAYGLRVLGRSPGFAVASFLSLALGIGAAAAVFQLLDAVRLRSLPIADPHELVEIAIEGGNQGFGLNRRWNGATYPLWEQIRDHQTALSGVFAWSPVPFTVGRDAGSRRVRGAWVSGTAFSVLGLAAQRGRLFTPDDEEDGCEGTAVLSHGFWQREFGGSAAAVGSQLLVNGQPVTVVGVSPSTFQGLEVGGTFDVALPFCVLGGWAPERLEARNEFWLRVFGRLAPGSTVDAASQYLEAASVGWFENVEPSNYTASLMNVWRGFRLAAEARPNGVSALRDAYEAPLWLLLGITALVMVITCSNVANLTLARTLSRRQEIATRLAIGASRRRVLSQLCTEGLLVAVIGTVGGAVLAGALSRGLIQFLRAQGVLVELDVSLGWRAASFLAACGAASCVLFGVTTALHAMRGGNNPAPDLAARGSRAGSRRVPLQRLLVSGQVAVSVVLVVASLALVKSFWNLFTLDAGFIQEGIVFSALDLDQTRAPRDALPQLKRSLLAGIRSIPGVESASTSTHLPLNGGRTSLAVRAPGSREESLPQFAWVSPGYFETMGIPVLAGRDFTEFDGADAPRVLVVNERFAREFLRGADPIGDTVESLEEPGYPRTVYEVVGVVGNTKYADLREGLPAIAYAPDEQEPLGAARMTVVTRSPLPPALVAASIARVIDRVNPAVVNSATVDLRATALASLMRERLLAWLAAFFGAVAIGLVGVGLYGVVSYVVSSRRRELGIRMALGAAPRSLVAMVVGQTVPLLLLGCTVGIAGGLAITHAAERLLFGVAPRDPAAFGTAIVVLIAVALGAAYVPGRAAARTNPLEALREP